jgi:hypothetical protein
MDGVLRSEGCRGEYVDLRQEMGKGTEAKPHNEVLHNLYSSSDVSVIVSERIGWLGHVADM